VFQLLVTTNVVSSSPIFVAVMIEAVRSSETSILARARRCSIPEEGIIHVYEASASSSPPVDVLRIALLLQQPSNHNAQNF
jgi:hypothetical protein